MTGHDYTSVCPVCRAIAFASKKGTQPMCGGHGLPKTSTHDPVRMVPWDEFQKGRAT